MPALELSFRLQCARMLAAQIKSVPVKAMREALPRHAVADPTYDAQLLAILDRARDQLAALDELDRAPPVPVAADWPTISVEHWKTQP
jgi:hypothetical protein